MTETNAARLYERIRADEELTKTLFRQALQDPKGTINTILALGQDWDLPVTEAAVKEHLASLDDDTKQWLIKARGGL
ncbi:MAG: hypothetical protein HQ527_03075 [Cyanobacteria bacterium]|nr:hypothetical protein [Cyanobacteria bacterium bin.51]